MFTTKENKTLSEAEIDIISYEALLYDDGECACGGIIHREHQKSAGCCGDCI